MPRYVKEALKEVKAKQLARNPEPKHRTSPAAAALMAVKEAVAAKKSRGKTASKKAADQA